MRILVADSHPLVRRGIRQVLADEFGSDEFGEAQDTGELIRLLGLQTWDLLVLDISLPGIRGVELIRSIRARYGNLRLVILSSYTLDETAGRILQAGADAVVLKDHASEDLMEAVHGVLRGENFVSVGLMEDSGSMATARGETPSPSPLSDVEKLVIRLYDSGNTLSEIARALSLQPWAVSLHRAHILKKLHTPSL